MVNPVQPSSLSKPIQDLLNNVADEAEQDKKTSAYLLLADVDGVGANRNVLTSPFYLDAYKPQQVLQTKAAQETRRKFKTSANSCR